METPLRVRLLALLGERKATATPQPEVGYEPGFFSQPMRAGFPQRFESQIRGDPRTKRFETDFARQERLRQGSGWNTRPMALPGSLT